jgi:Probable Zinc-ribbon domain
MTRVVPPSKSLAALYPEIARQLHPTLNEGLTAEMVTAHSSKRLWWQCDVDVEHVWRAHVGARTQKVPTGCPSCARTRSVPPSKSLAALYPEIARQLHPTLNEGLTADMVTAHSKKRLWWQCHINAAHVWDTEVSNRVKGTRCPFCAHKKPDATNSLLALYPEVARDWHYEKNRDLHPETVLPSSNKTVWWHCQVDASHEWRDRIWVRTKNQVGCPFCSGRLVTDANRLTLRCPEIAAEFHPKLNRMLYPMFEGNKTWYPKNRLAENDRPKRNRRLKASDVTYNSKEKIWWQCRNSAEHVWQAPINQRTKQGYGCPFCAGKRVAADNSLAALYPALARRFVLSRNAPDTPNQIHPGAKEILVALF